MPTTSIALRKAPVAEPYLGPAILEGKAASVFFHEVFGHRIEGHRQKDEQEGQTFAKKVGQPIMPDFISVFDDPSIATLNGIDVNGFYRYDDEGVPGAAGEPRRERRAQDVPARALADARLREVERPRPPAGGLLGRGAPGQPRRRRVAHRRPRGADAASCSTRSSKQGKPYGYVFRELDGGFTMTRRFEPQSFKLLPIMVYRVYPDGHEELVRGADLEGTPLRALADIVAAADDVDDVQRLLRRRVRLRAGLGDEPEPARGARRGREEGRCARQAADLAAPAAAEVHDEVRGATGDAGDHRRDRDAAPSTKTRRPCAR